MNEKETNKNLGQFTNPFAEQLEKYKWIVFWCAIAFFATLALIQIYFNVPTIDASNYLGDLYILYMFALGFMVSAMAGMLFIAGMAFQTLLLKQATDKQLLQLSAISKAENNPSYKQLLEEDLTYGIALQKKEKKAQ